MLTDFGKMRDSLKDRKTIWSVNDEVYSRATSTLSTGPTWGTFGGHSEFSTKLREKSIQPMLAK